MNPPGGSGSGSALLHREYAPADLSALVPVPRRETLPAIPDPVAAGRDEPLDVRLHAPTPDAVVVRVAGALHLCNCGELTTRVRQQLCRAPHVVVDLTSVSSVDVRVAGELRTLRARAVGCGTHLHIAAENERVVEVLRRVDVGEPVVNRTADAVLACLAPRNG